jgi:hypothetical protein
MTQDGSGLLWASYSSAAAQRWQAAGREFNYLVGTKDTGVYLCRWPVAAPTHLDDLIEACRTAVDVASPEEGRRLAALFEAGEAIPEIGWFPEGRNRVTRASDTPVVAYDPIPDLAALLDELEAWARGGGRQATMERIMTGPYARLRSGLPTGAEAAIREAIQAFTTKTGRLLPPSEIAALATEAERGYDVSQLGPLRVQYGSLEELTGATRRKDPREMLAAGELSTHRVGQLDLEQAIRRATPEQLHLAVSVVWEPERYAELAEAMTAESGQDPRA